MPKRRRAPWFVLEHLRQSLEAAQLKRCSVDQEAQAAMKLYLDTWVVPGIEATLRWARGEEFYAG